MQTNFIDKSIFTRTYILHFIALFSVISLISGVLVYNGQRIIVDSENQLLQNTENNRLKLVKNITRFYIDQFISDVKFLSKSESLLRFFISRKPRIDKVYVEKEFTKMAKERKVYDQIRFINMHGKEVVRINYNNGDPAIVPERDLQDKSGRYYFQDSLETQYNQVYISPIDLNKEKGKIEQPIKPMIRIGTTVLDGYNNKKGIVLLNYYGQEILTQIENLLSNSLGEPMMFNNNGYWLLDSDKNKLWGFMYNNNKTLEKIDHELWREINTKDSGQVKRKNELYLFTTIPLVNNGNLSKMENNYWKLVIRLKPKTVLSGDNSRRYYFFLLLIVQAIVSWSIIYFYHQKKYIRHIDSLSSSVFNSSLQGIFISDKNNNIISVNPAFTEITGFQFKDVAGKNVSILSSDKHDSVFFKRMWKILKEKDKWVGEIWNKTKNGNVFPALFSISAINNNRKAQYYVFMFSDITRQKSNEEKLVYDAHYDPLTELPNRQLFRENLIQTLTSQKKKIPSVLLFIDLDKFKEVNDTLGHAVGDELLIEVGNRLQSCIRESDIAARLGGDEFTVILNNIKLKDHAILVIEKILSKMNDAFILSGNEIFISVSIGAVIFSQNEFEIEELLNYADQAMYQAKQSGKNTFCFYKHP